jgi:general secretion pathway protein E
MNAPADLQALIAAFDPNALRRAKKEAAQKGLSLSAVLEAQGEHADSISQRLARTAGLPFADHQRLNALQPAFDALPYAEAMQHECLFMRDEEGRSVLVVADPFDNDLLSWAQERVRRPMAIVVASRGDIEAYLARHGEDLRAMDGLSTMAGEADEGQRVEDISLRSISEDTSPVVRLVNSTL